MPLIEKSSYQSPWLLFNRHLETIVPSLFRKVEGVEYRRERLELSDGDFLDLDWLEQDSGKLMIFTHGLEGNSHRHYSKSIAKYFFQRGWDALAWNCRSCSGEMNRLPRFYHHGATEDLSAVIEHALKRNKYSTIVLTGLSMGGNMTIKYLGESGQQLSDKIKGAALFSVPCDLPASARKLDLLPQKIYRIRFLRKLRPKIKWKSERFPDRISFKGYDSITTFREFDARYTAPLHGYRDADDFYDHVSPLPFIAKVGVPTLIVNALNDPFLPSQCFPYELIKKLPNVYLESPGHGGHSGFSLPGKQENYMDIRSYEFLKDF